MKELLTVRPVETDSDIQRCFDIRREVFIVEQACPPEEEWDEWDNSSIHYLAENGGEIVGTARMREISREGMPTAKLERFAILEIYRGRGFGKQLIEAVIKDAFDKGYRSFYIHAQKHLYGLYHSMGFEQAGDEFMEAGTPHLPMAMVRED